MSSCTTEVAAAVPEQLCYFPCNFCNMVLAVSVPCNSLFDMVTVRCGHCTNLWSVNMAAAFQSLSWQDLQVQLSQKFQAPNASATPHEYKNDHFGSSSRAHNKMAAATRPAAMAGNRGIHEDRIVNGPPEKRQRVPSAYNQFIKEEIQRIKANNPDISHREAFSTAAKNWAHFPHIHFGLMLESNVNHQPKVSQGSEQRLMPRSSTVFNK